MLRVTIEVTGETIYVIDIQNDGTGTKKIGNYDIELRRFDGRGVQEERVENFPRKDGALRLIQKAIEELEKYEK